jgi:DNA-binding CsgD family transcriptional regulator
MGWDQENVIDLLSVVDALELTDSPEALLKEMASAFSRWGFDHVMLAQLINPAVADKPLREYGVTNYPEEWTERWFEGQRAMHDPVMRFGANSSYIFKWSDVRDYADKIGLRMMDEGRDFGLEDGIGVPVAIPRLPTGLIGLPHQNPDFSESDLAQLSILSVQSYTHFLKLTGAQPDEPPQHLTARETEIMHYVAAGKSNWDISHILGISSSTVKFHMKNITRKLNAVNRAHSVFLAIRSGRILVGGSY